MKPHPWAVMLPCLWPTLGGAMEPLAPNSEAPSPAALSTWRYLTRLEATGLALLPSSGGGGVEHYAQLTPMLVVDGGESFGHKLYALAEGGTLLFPQGDGALRPGAFASLGLGVDDAR